MKISELDRHIGIGFSQLRYLPPQLKEILQERGLWEDLQQTIYLSAVEASCFDPDTQVKEISRIVQREIYEFLKSHGYRRVRGYSGYVLKDVPKNLKIF
jgi:hypothetical protein